MQRLTNHMCSFLLYMNFSFSFIQLRYIEILLLISSVICLVTQFSPSLYAHIFAKWLSVGQICLVSLGRLSWHRQSSQMVHCELWICWHEYTGGDSKPRGTRSTEHRATAHTAKSIIHCIIVKKVSKTSLPAHGDTLQASLPSHDATVIGLIHDNSEKEKGERGFHMVQE